MRVGRLIGLMLPLACLAASVTPWTNPLVKPAGAWKAWCDGKAYAWVSEKAGDAVEVEFEGETYRAPGCHGRYLSQLYGADYMQLPPEEKRRSHHVFHMYRRKERDIEEE